MTAVEFIWPDDDTLQVVRSGDGEVLRTARIEPSRQGLFRVILARQTGSGQIIHVPEGYDTANKYELRRMARQWAQDPELLWPPRELRWSLDGPTAARVSFHAKFTGDAVYSPRSASIWRLADAPENHPNPWRISLEDRNNPPGWAGGRTLYGWDRPTREAAESIAEEWVRDGIFKWENPRDAHDDSWARRLMGDALRKELLEVLGEGAEVVYRERDDTAVMALPVKQAQALVDILRGLRRLTGTER